MEKELYVLIILSACISIVSSLECYACLNQDNNRDKCVTTTKQCDQFQDACTTYVRWGIPPYWTPHGDRQYHISKDCDTRVGCNKRQSAMQTHCKRDWYLDWACVECCTGDLCNYYVTMGAGNAKSSLLAMFTSLFAFVTVWMFHK